MEIENKLEECSCKLSIKSLVDTGSPISLLKFSVLQNFMINKFEINDNSFIGINGSKLTIVGLCMAKVYFENKCFDLTFHVVPDDTMQSDALLGRDFLDVTISKLFVGNTVLPCDKDSLPGILNMDIEGLNKSYTYDIIVNTILPVDVENKIPEVFQTYYINGLRPENPPINYEINIKLMQDKTICHAPRRLSITEELELKR